MKKELEKNIRASSIKIKLVERAGESVKRLIQRSDPFKEKKCSRENSLVCRTGGSGPCSAFGVTYEIKCEECSRKYVGETSRSAYTRGVEHLRDVDGNREQSVLGRHTKEEHGGVFPDFTMSVTSVHGTDAMMRQVTESILIRRDRELNNKTEWNNFSLPREVIEN